MVSLEDYEYSAFRCAFCKVLNPAKKIRPKAPALVEDFGSRMQSTSSSTSSSDNDSGSEREQNERPRQSSTDGSQQELSPFETNIVTTTHDGTEPSQSKKEEIINEIVEEIENVVEKSESDKKTD